MTAFTGGRILDTECHAETVAGAAEFPLVHFFHDPAFVRITGWYDRIMTIVAVIAFFSVGLMAEIHVAGIGRKFVTDSSGRCRMTFLTVGFYTESRLVVVTAAAGFSLFHLGHAEAFVARSRHIQGRMTILTAVGGNMGYMTEDRAAGTKVNLFDSVALLAIRLDAKGAFTVMTRAAGIPLFHVSHGAALAFLAGDKDPVMTIGTFEQRCMN